MPAEAADPAGCEILCTGLTKRFGPDVLALEGIDLRVPAGQTVALLGPSGCGKSTLLRLIAGLEQPSAGEVRIDGAPPAALARQGALSVAFQDPCLLPWLSVARNVALGRKLSRLPADPVAARRLIALVGLEGFRNVRPAALSGGMRQRAAIARALLTRPRVLLLDEPFGALDALTRRQLARDLPPLWRAQGATTVLVTHSVDEAVLLADSILVLSPRPARILARLQVPLAWPRSPDLVQTRRFRDLAGAALGALARGGDAAPAAVSR